MLGRSVAGPQRDAELRFVPSVVITWASWQDEHPNTKFLDTGSLGRPYNFYDQYYADPDMVGAYGENNPDRRFHAKDIVLGTAVGEHARAYSSRDLFGDAVINDTLGKTAIVVAREEMSGVTAVFDRSAAGRTLTFKQADEPLRMIDEQTNSIWNKTNGRGHRRTTSGQATFDDTQLPPLLVRMVGLLPKHDDIPRVGSFQEFYRCGENRPDPTAAPARLSTRRGSTRFRTGPCG